MGSSITPTTALLYAYVNLEPSELPTEAPEEDVFARAFKHATQDAARRREKETYSVLGEGFVGECNDDILFDDFLSKDAFTLEERSPSSDSSSSVGRLSSGPISFPSSSTTLSPFRDMAKVYDITPTINEIGFPQLDPECKMLEDPDLSLQGDVDGSRCPVAPEAVPLPQPKKSRRRGKRKKRSEEEQAEKRKAFLERNRMAAQKCRSRKREKTTTLEDDLAMQEQENLRLKDEVMGLRAELAKLRDVYTQCEKECRGRVNRECKKESLEAD